MVSVTEQTSRRRKFNAGFDRFSGLYLWAVFIVVFGIWVPNEFLTTSTLHGVASAQAVTGIVGLAVLIPLSAGLYDLSVGATANVTGILAVVLINDDDHSYEYVIRMLKQLFGYPEPKGFLLAAEVDTTGRAIVYTTTREHAELKQDQIHAFGPDAGIPRCQGSMTAVIEPAPG